MSATDGIAASSVPKKMAKTRDRRLLADPPLTTMGPTRSTKPREPTGSAVAAELTPASTPRASEKNADAASLKPTPPYTGIVRSRRRACRPMR